MEKSDSLSKNEQKYKSRKSSSFKLKFLLYFLPPILLVSTFLVILSTAFSRNIAIENENKQVSSILDAQSEKLSTYIYNRDFLKLSALLRQVFGKDQVKEISVFNLTKGDKSVIFLNDKNNFASVKTHSHQIALKGPQDRLEKWQIEIKLSNLYTQKLIELFIGFQLAIVLTMSMGMVIGVFVAFDHYLMQPFQELRRFLLSGESQQRPSEGSHRDEITEIIEDIRGCFEQIFQTHKNQQKCLEASDTTMFEYDLNNDKFSFFTNTIPETPVNTDEIKNLENFKRFLKAENTPDAEIFWHKLKSDLTSETTGIRSQIFKINHKNQTRTERIWLKITFYWNNECEKPFITGQITNITPQKNLEINLIESKNDFKHLLENTSTGIFKSRLDRFFFMNTPLARMLGYSTPDEAVANIRSISHQFFARNEDSTFFQDRLKKIGSIQNLEFNFKRADKTVFCGLISANLVKNHQGNFTQGCILDITDKKEAEDSLRNIEKSMRLSLDASKTLAFRLDLESERIELTGPVEEIFAVASEKLTNLKSLKKFIHPDDLGLFPPSIVATDKTSSENAQINLRICVNKASDEIETKWLGIDWGLLSFGSHNRPVAIHGLIKDISLQKIKEQELVRQKDKAIQTSQLKSDFFADMSHEIRTPLNAIIGFSELLEPVVKDNSNCQNYVNSILTASRNLLNIINDILDLSRLEAGKLEINPEPVSIEVLSHEIISIFSAQAQAKGIELSTHIDDSVPSILLIDSLRIKQIINNLVANAIKFTPSGKVSLFFGASPSKESNTTTLNISVEDTGVGIDQSESEQIFKPFAQRKGQDTRMGGTGLGLAISKKLIETMNGTISLTSEPGKGSKFEVCLKDVNIDKYTIKTKYNHKEKASQFSFARQKILVVDDTSSNRELLSEALSAAGLEVIAAQDGQEAVELANTHSPELIIMDIRMPKKNGIEASIEIKAKHNIPIIALTASLSTGNDENLKIFDGILHKPVKLYDLFTESGRFLQFDIKDRKVFDEEIKDTTPSTAFEQIIEPRQLAEKIGQNILLDLEKLEGAYNIDEIKAFANKLRNLAQKHSFNLLTLEAKDLYKGANQYNTNTMEHALHQISKTLGLFLNFFRQNKS
jgi:PAS domain S-box-containing protein